MSESLTDQSELRSPEELQIHPSLIRLGLAPAVAELNRAVQDQAIVDPIAITRTGVILEGHDRWFVAKAQHRAQVQCIVHSLNEPEAR